MHVGQVSFGKIVKVNASYDVAKQIEAIANGKQTKVVKLNDEVKKLFNDVSEGDAHTFRYDKRSSYIFSGVEGKKYWDFRSETIDKMHKIKDNTKDNRKKEEGIVNAWNQHRCSVFDLINNHGIDTTIDPSTNKKNKVRTINYEI